MDPPAMMNEGSPYKLSEIWQFLPMNGGGELVMGLRRPQFGNVNGATNREVSGNDPMSLDQRGVHGGGSRKRRDLEDNSSNSKGVDSDNGAVFASNFVKIYLCSLPLNLYEHKS
ncbi:transcription factor BPE-like [Castanea sativa]|uniref:transcription factor BPE-like n=1 Tax=Castanea sativa TaxID=21020 RepID=UPI003F64B729